MDRTINKIIVGFIILVVFDATSFNISKQKFGLLGSIVNTVKTVKSIVTIVK